MTDKKKPLPESGQGQPKQSVAQSAPAVANTSTKPADKPAAPPKKSAASAPSASATDSSQNASGKSLAALALVIGIIAIVISALLWFQGKEEMEQNIGLQAQLAQSSQNLDSVTQQITATVADNQRLHQQLADQKQLIDNQSVHIEQLVAAMQDLRQDLEPERDRLVLARVRELIYQAQSVTAISRQNINYVIDLLKESQERMESITDPKWDGLKQKLIVDIDRLSSVAHVSTVAVFEQIEQVRRQIRSLGFQQPGAKPKVEQQPVSGADSAASMLEGFANKLAQQLQNMVVIRSNEDGLMIQLHADSFQHVKLLLESGLSQAQLGLLQHNENTFTQSLNQVMQTLEQRLREYDVADELDTVRQALATPLFDVPSGLESYTVLKQLEKEDNE